MVLLVLLLWYPMSMKHCTVDLLASCLAMLPKTTCICSPSLLCMWHCSALCASVICWWGVFFAASYVRSRKDKWIVYFCSMSYVENVKSTQLGVLVCTTHYGLFTSAFLPRRSNLGPSKLLRLLCNFCYQFHLINQGQLHKSTSLMFFGS